MFYRRFALGLSLSLSCVIGCVNTVPTDDSSWPSAPEGPPSAAEQLLMDYLRAQYPGGFDAIPGTEERANILGSGSGLARAPAMEGVPIPIAIQYSLPASPSDLSIDAMCVGFGSAARAYCIPRSDLSSTSDGETGVLGLSLRFPPEMCSMLSSICHDIRCYEFARTSAGTFSRANLSLLAAQCGGCDEPSCQSLLDSCGSCDACMVGEACVDGMCIGDGVLRFTLQWSTSSDLDLHVRTPSGAVISFRNRTADGGTLDNDSRGSTAAHVENVFFDSTALPGRYEYWVDNFSGAETSFQLTAFVQGARVDSVAQRVGSGEESVPRTLNF